LTHLEDIHLEQTPRPDNCDGLTQLWTNVTERRETNLWTNGWDCTRTPKSA
jgi:hypothetical protein